jgi:hypothetical protein
VFKKPLVEAAAINIRVKVVKRWFAPIKAKVRLAE